MVTLAVSLHVSLVDEGELTVTTLLVTVLALVPLSTQTQQLCQHKHNSHVNTNTAVMSTQTQQSCQHTNPTVMSTHKPNSHVNTNTTVMSTQEQQSCQHKHNSHVNTQTQQSCASSFIVVFKALCLLSQ